MDPHQGDSEELPPERCAIEALEPRLDKEVEGDGGEAELDAEDRDDEQQRPHQHHADPLLE